jgi:hypothetical protein
VLHDILTQAVNTGLHVQLSGSRRNAFHLLVVFLRLLHLYCFGRHPTAIQGRQNMHWLSKRLWTFLTAQQIGSGSVNLQARRTYILLAAMIQDDSFSSHRVVL